MSSSVDVTGTAATNEGMTVGELQTFIDDCYRAGVSIDRPVRMKAGWRQQILRITTGKTP